MAKGYAGAALALFVGLFSVAAGLYADCPSCVDTGNSACRPWGSGRAKFLWTSAENPGSNITLTAGPCGQCGESGSAIIFSYIDAHSASCNGSTPCSGYGQNMDDTFAIIKVTGNKKAFKHIFPDGLTFTGDKLQQYTSQSWYWSCTTVTQTGCDFALNLSGSQTSKIRLGASVAQCDPEYNNSKFNITIKFYEKRSEDPESYCLLATTNGSITVKANRKRDFDVQNFKPDLKDGSSILKVKPMLRAYTAQGGQSIWSLSYRQLNWDLWNCSRQTGWAGTVSYEGNYLIPETETYYRIKYPGWSEAVSGRPDYAAEDGWDYDAGNNRLSYDMGVQGKMYYHCRPAPDGSFLVQKVEYCTQNQQTGSGQTLWTVFYDSQDKIKYIHNGTNPNDPNTPTSATQYYEYVWAGDGNDPTVTYSNRPDTQSIWQTERQWQLEFDSQDRAVKFQGGCSGGCGGSGEFEHIEYHPDYEDLIVKRFNAAGDTILENEYEIIEYGEYEPAGWIYIPNGGFEYPDVPAYDCRTGLPDGWTDFDTNLLAEVCDPNDRGSSSQVLRPSGDRIYKNLSDYVLMDTVYMFEASVKALDLENASNAVIELQAMLGQTAEVLATIDVNDIGGIELVNGQWKQFGILWDSKGRTNITDCEPPATFRIVVSGDHVDIDDIRLSASMWIGDKTQPIIKRQKIYDPIQQKMVTVLERSIDKDNLKMTERRYVSEDSCRVAVYEYEDNSFTNITRKTEYETIGSAQGLPSGEFSLTTYNVDDPNGIYIKNYPGGKRADYEKLGTHGQVVESYIIDLANDANYLRQQYEYSENYFPSGLSGWKVSKNINPRGGLMQYEYYTDAGHLLKKQTDPNTVAGRQITEYVYDSSRRILTERRKNTGGNWVRTKYNYNPDTGYPDSVVADEGGQNQAITRYKYNHFGQVTRQINPDGVITGKSYGLGGEPVSEFVISADSDPNDPDSSLKLISQTKYTYTADGYTQTVSKAKHTGQFDFDSPGDWIVTKYEYDVLGRRTKVIEDYDPAGQRANLATVYKYNYQNEIEQISYPTGKWVRTTRNGQGMVTFETVGYGTDTIIMETAYDYDDNGNLIEQVNPDGTSIIYQYDNYGRLEKTYKYSTAGPCTVREYDTAGAVKRQYSLESDDTMLADRQTDYDVVGNVIFERVLAEPNQPGNTSDFIAIYQYDVAGNLRTTIQKGIDCGDIGGTAEPDDLITSFFYDRLNRKIRYIDPESVESFYTYTSAGLPEVIVAPNTGDPNAYITTNIYDPYGRLEKTINPEGHYTVNYYNSLNQVYRQLVYDCKGTPGNQEDDLAVRQVRSEYDNLGRIKRRAVMADPAAGGDIQVGIDLVTDYVYDPDSGLLWQEKIYYGPNATAAVTTYYYDQIARPRRTVDAQGSEELVTYYTIAEGGPARIKKMELIERDPADSNNDYTITSFFEYDDYGRLYKQILDTDGDGVKESTDLTTTSLYDGLDRLKSRIDNDEIVTFYDYDAFGNVKTAIDDYNPQNPDAFNRETGFEYDRLGRQITVTAYDPNEATAQVDQQVTEYKYNKLGLVTEIIYPDQKNEQYFYNIIGRVDHHVRRDGSTIYYWYDYLGNTTAESDAPDAFEPTANPSFLTMFTYNGAGDIVYAGKDENGSVAAESEFSYNGFGQAKSESACYFDLEPAVTEWTYDGAANLVTQTHCGQTITYTHDGLGRIKTIDRNNDRIVNYAYIGSGTKSIEYPEPQTTQQFGYDKLGRMNQCRSADSEDGGILDLNYTHDGVGNRDSQKYNHLETPVWDKYYYDNLRRLFKAEYGGASGFAQLLDFAGDVQFAADVAGRWLVCDGSFAELAQEQVELLNNRHKGIQQTLAETGIDSLMKKYAGGDMPVLLLAEFAEDTKTDTNYEVYKDGTGKIIAVINYDKLGRMTLFTMYPDIGGTIIITISYDKAGGIKSEITAVYDSTGKLVDRYDMTAVAAASVSALSTKTSAMVLPASESTAGGMTMMMSVPGGPAAASEQFTYDHLGNREQYMGKDGYTSTFTHNAVNQYLHIQKPLPLNIVENTYPAHDDNGNLTSDGLYGYGYEYDYRNRLIKITSGASVTAEFAYDALGRRIRKIADGTTTYFYYDAGEQVIAEYEIADSSPVLARTFVYGNRIDEVLAMFLPEHEGSVDDLQQLIDFCAAWLSDPNDSNYDDSLDVVDDDFIDMQDFAYFASVWDVPSSHETRWYYLHDALGSVRGLVGGKYNRQEDREFYNYDVYGKPSIQNPEESKSGNPYLFTGRRLDIIDEGSLTIYYYRGRSYNAGTGRFMQFDPLGYADSMSLYEYVTSNPANYTDPWGLTPVETREQIDRKMGYGDSSPWDDPILDVSRRTAGTMLMVPVVAKEQLDCVVGGVCEFLGNPGQHLESMLSGAMQTGDKLIDRNIQIVIRVSDSEHPGQTYYSEQLQLGKDLYGPIATQFLEKFCKKADRAGSEDFWDSCKARAEITVTIVEVYYSAKGAAELAKGLTKNADDAIKSATSGKCSSSTDDAAKATKRPGSKGLPDHRAKVKELRDAARNELRPGETVRQERQLRNIPGSKRRPDVQILDPQGKTRKVFEAERNPGGKYNRLREQEYDRLGIEYETHGLD